MKKKKVTSRAVDSFSVSFRATTFAVSCIRVSFSSNLVLLFCLNLKAPKFVTFKLLIYSNVPKCILVPLQVSTCWDLIPRGGTPYNGLYGEAPPEMGTFLRLQGQGYERVGISLVEVYERVGRSVISVGKKRVQKG